MTLRRFVRSHAVVAFFVLAYAISWSSWMWTTSRLAGLFGPAIAAVAITAIVDGHAGVRRLLSRLTRGRVAVGWWLVAVSPLIAYAAIAVIAGWPRLSDLGRFDGAPDLGIVGAWLIVLAAGFGEETGWRGFALPRLERTYTPLASIALLGVLWAGWQLPLFGFGPAALPWFVLAAVAGSVVLAWLYHRTHGSVLMVALGRASFAIATGSVAAHGSIGAMVVLLMVAWAVVLVALELKLRRDRATVLGVTFATASGSARLA